MATLSLFLSRLTPSHLHLPSPPSASPTPPFSSSSRCLPFSSTSATPPQPQPLQFASTATPPQPQPLHFASTATPPQPLQFASTATPPQPQPLQFVSTTTQPQPQPLQFAAQYLIQSCGLPPDKALRASKYIPHLKSPDKPDAVLRFLRQSGISDYHITTAVSLEPRILSSHIEKNWRPNVAKLQEVGLSIEDISGVISRSPNVFMFNFVPKIDFWIGALGSKENLSMVLKRSAQLLSSNLEKVAVPNLSFLRQQCGLSVPQIVRLMRSNSRVITSSSEALKIKAKRAEELGVSPSSPMFVYALITVCQLNQRTIDARLSNLTSFGLSQQEIITLVSKLPSILNLPHEVIGRKVEFLTKEMGCDKLLLVTNPSLLAYSLEKRLIPRSRVRKLLGLKGLPVANLKCASLMCPSQKLFLEKFVMPYEDAIPGLHQAYMDACAGNFEGLQWFDRALQYLDKKSSVLPAPQPLLDFWVAALGSIENLSVALRRSGRLLGSNLEKVVVPNLSFLREQCGLSVPQIVQLIKLDPRAITSSPEALKIKAKRAEELGVSRSSPMFVYALITVCKLNQQTIDARLSNLTSLGFSQQEVLTLISKQPFLLKLPEEVIGRKVEFLTKEMDCDKSQLVTNPSLLAYSLEKRLIPRSRVRKLLGLKGLPVANLKCASLMCPSQKLFLEKFVMPYEDAIPGLHQAYMDACAGNFEGLQWFDRALQYLDKKSSVLPAPQPLLDFWVAALGSIENLSVALRRSGRLLGSNLEKVVVPNLSFLREQCGLSVPQIVQLIKLDPRAITSSPEALKIKAKRAEELGVSRSSPMFVYALITVCKLNQQTIDARLSNLTSLGFSQQEVLTLVSKQPFLLKLPEEVIGRKVEFLTKEMGCDKLQLVTNPSLLAYSLEKRLIPRSRVRKLLGLKGLPVANLKCMTFMQPSLKVFMEKFVLPYENAIPGLHQAYMDACAGNVEGLQ